MPIAPHLRNKIRVIADFAKAAREDLGRENSTWSILDKAEQFVEDAIAVIRGAHITGDGRTFFEGVNYKYASPFMLAVAVRINTKYPELSKDVLSGQIGKIRLERGMKICDAMRGKLLMTGAPLQTVSTL